jgi:replicative DNA helicase
VSTSPHNLDAERSVLGAVLVDNDALDLVSARLKPEHFFRRAHADIYDAMLELRRRRQKFDVVYVAELLTTRQQLEDVGGLVYLSELLDGSFRGVNIVGYAEIVFQKAALRQVIEVSKSAIQSALAQDLPAEEVINKTEAELTRIAMHAAQSDLVGGQALSSEAMAWLEEVSARREGSRLSGISTGLVDLDLMTDGFQPGDLILVGARPSQGKTALALQFALSADVPTAFFSLEMGRAQLSARALAWLARVDGWALRKGLLSRPEYERVSKALTQLAESGLAIDDASEMNVWQLRSKARRWKAQHGLKMCVVDYLQLMTPTHDKRRQTTREQEVAAMSRSLKGIAKELQVPMIVLAQLGRKAEDRASEPPKLSDLRESGALEQDADLVIFVHRPNGMTVKDEGEAHLIVAKHRNGPTGTVPTWWVPSQTRFRPMPDGSGVEQAMRTTA